MSDHAMPADHIDPNIRLDTDPNGRPLRSDPVRGPDLVPGDDGDGVRDDPNSLDLDGHDADTDEYPAVIVPATPDRDSPAFPAFPHPDAE